MNTHFCKVGTIRPSMNTVEESIVIENNSIESKVEKTKPNNLNK